MKVLLISSTRADYSYLHPLIREIKKDSRIISELLVTGTHLEAKFGKTIKNILQDEIKINYQFSISYGSGTIHDTCHSLGETIKHMSKVIMESNPDLVIVPYDRYEILGCAMACIIHNIPMAHLGGGDTTEGAIDDIIRNQLTACSILHFPSNEESKKKILSLGANPKYVFNVGSLSIDSIKEVPLIDKNTFQDLIHFKLKAKNILFTYHPETKLKEKSLEAFFKVKEALSRLSEDQIGIIITQANSDPFGEQINQELEKLSKNKKNILFRANLGRELYYSAISHVDCVVGNSSSGIYEVPYFKKVTINIGNRQKGRLQLESIINVDHDTEKILSAIDKAFKMRPSSMGNPYGDGNSASKIVEKLIFWKKENQLD